MRPLSTTESIWLARGEALGRTLLLAQRWLHASMAQLLHLGLVRKRLP